jgi:hypothetical protein
LVDGEDGNEQSTDGGAKEPKLMNDCMVLEWMDTDLWQLPSEPFRSSSSPLSRIVARSILEALVLLDGLGSVHTGQLHLSANFSFRRFTLQYRD